MLTFITVFFTIILVLICIFLVLLILMQRASSDSGLGSTLGGGVAESTFGAETTHVLTKVTVKLVIAFFVLVFGLYLVNLYLQTQDEKANPTFSAQITMDAPKEDTKKEQSSDKEQDIKEKVSQEAKEASKETAVK